MFNRFSTLQVIHLKCISFRCSKTLILPCETENMLLPSHDDLTSVTALELKQLYMYQEIL